MEEERERSVREFERTMMGLEGAAQQRGEKSADVARGETGETSRGAKRKFELNEEEMLKNVKEERAKARKAIDDEKVHSTSDPRVLYSTTDITST